MKKTIENINGMEVTIEVSDFLLDHDSGNYYYNINYINPKGWDKYIAFHIWFSKLYQDWHKNEDSGYYENILEYEIYDFIKNIWNIVEYNNSDFFIYYKEKGRTNEVFHPFIIPSYIQQVKSNPSSDAAFTRLANK